MQSMMAKGARLIAHGSDFGAVMVGFANAGKTLAAAMENKPPDASAGAAFNP